jgi:hypothetical protein
MNLGSILRILGVKMTREQVKQLEEILPQIPAKAGEVVKAVNDSLRNFDERLRGIEARQEEILALFKKGDM